MNYYGYHRTSTNKQHLDRGISEIENYCREHDIHLKKIYTDKTTGTDFNRPRYTVLKEDVLEAGDVLIITEIDRLGRNKNDTLTELRDLSQMGVRVMILEIPTTLLDTSPYKNDLSSMLLETINNMLIEMYSSFAQAENEKRKKRQQEGMDEMRKRGEWEKFGRPRKMDKEKFAIEYQNVLIGKERPTDLMKRLDLKFSTYYKYRKEYMDNKQN